MKERRKFIRIDKDSLIEFKEFEYPVKGKDYLFSKLKNIGGSGLLLKSKKKYKIGTLLHLKIVLTSQEKDKPEIGKEYETSVSHPLSIIGKVVRIEEIEKGSYNIGIMFANFYENDAAALADFINNNLKNE